MSAVLTGRVESGHALPSHGAGQWRTVLRQRAEQLEESAAILMRGREGNPAHGLKGPAPTEGATEERESILAEVLQAIERVAGLCRLFGARRAAVFCADLAALFIQLVRTSAPLPADSIELMGVNLLQVTRFLLDLQPPVSDVHFDLATLNALRLAIGKSPLPLSAHGEPAAQSGPWNACDLSEIRALLLERVRGAQAMLGQVSGAAAIARAPTSELANELRAIASVLQVLGRNRLGWADVDDCRDVEQAVGLLLRLELELSAGPEPCTPSSGSLPGERRSARDCVLLDAQRQWRAEAYQRLNSLTLALAEAPLTEGAIPERVAGELLSLWASLQLAGDVITGLVPWAGWPQLLASGVSLARHLQCWQCVALSMDGALSPALATRGRQLLLRLQLHALDQLSPESQLPTPSWRRQQAQTLMRDCRHFQRLQRAVWRRRLVAEYSPDAELRGVFWEELRQTLHVLDRHLACPQGDTLCTVVARLSQNALVVGEVMLHEALEGLRQLLTVLLERQARVGAEQLALVESFRGHLRGCLCESPALEEEALASLQTRTNECATHLQSHPHADGSDVFLESMPVAIAQLPVYLAQNIRELLSAAERLEACAAIGGNSRADFAALNRMLIVELRMLAAGARALQVYRVARLSAVLAELHQALAVPTITNSDSRPDPDLLASLIDAHRLLRRGLNQAAARREVDNPRDVIAGLYRQLDQLQTPAPRRSETDWQPQHDTECYHDFRREAEELVESIEAHVGTLSSGVTASASAVLQDILHALHTLKGNARLFACERLAAVCHRCESALLEGHVAFRAQADAVAESERAVHYASGRGVQGLVGVFGQSRAGVLGGSRAGPLPQMVVLVSELRAAVDELPLAASAPLVPLPPERNIAIAAASLQRIAALVGSARTQVRAALDLLQSGRHEPDAARLSLLEDLLAEQERCVVQLDEEVAGSRLVSFSRVTARLQRLAGRHSNQLDRQLRLQVRNDGLRVDRLLLEQLVAPLEHLLRNAIDHGIEPVAVRRACGKADGGTVLLDLQERDDQLVLELRDDGAGINSDALLACAERLGMADSQVAAERRLQWVLLPGFSTRTQATQDSGHGIGLAMVNSVVTALGGRVEVESTAGFGSCFRLLLPRWDIAPKPV